MGALSYPCQRIKAFQALVSQIEAMGLLRDETGVTALASRVEKMAIPIDAIRSDEEVRRRRREADARQRQNRAALRVADPVRPDPKSTTKSTPPRAPSRPAALSAQRQEQP